MKYKQLSEEEYQKNYDKYADFLDDAYHISLLSKDPSTKVGSMYLNDQEDFPFSFGYNGMPRGLDDNHEERNQRPEKYFWTEHSERNNIYNIARQTLEGTMMFSTRYPDMESARAIVSCGIKKVIVEEQVGRDSVLSIDELKMDERVAQLFKETGTEFIKINRSEIEAGFSPYDQNNEVEKDNHKKLKEFNLKEKYLTFLDLAVRFAKKSPDREEKHAAMIFNSMTFAPIKEAFGFNSPPKGVPIADYMHEASEKKYWFQGGELNAIFNAVRGEFKDKTLISDWCPCINCALATVAVGTGKVVTRLPDFTKEADLRWKESFERTAHLYEVAENIQLVLLNVPKPSPILNNQKKNKKKM